MSCKFIPQNASQHATAGPYSPVIEVKADSIVVISGQAAIDSEGNIIGGTVREQTEYTLENCRKQLASVGCTFADVFKVNVFMADISKWDEFNQMYAKYMPEPRPVRTTVQAVLLDGLLIEIEMWAGKVKD